MTHKEQIINEILSAVTHAIGIGLSIWGLVLLILKGIRTNSILVAVTVIIYGITLIGLYLFSTLFHSLYFTKLSRIFQCFDHCGINLLIAGTYTPYCLLAIRGWLGIGMLVVIWTLALGGMAYHLFAKNRQQKVETLLYVLMGWMCLLGAKPLLTSLGRDHLIMVIDCWRGDFYPWSIDLQHSQFAVCPRDLAFAGHGRDGVHVSINLSVYLI